MKGTRLLLARSHGVPSACLPASLVPSPLALQIFQLFWTLLVAIPRPDAILVQNPPR